MCSPWAAYVGEGQPVVSTLLPLWVLGIEHGFNQNVLRCNSLGLRIRCRGLRLVGYNTLLELLEQVGSVLLAVM